MDVPGGPVPILIVRASESNDILFLKDNEINVRLFMRARFCDRDSDQTFAFILMKLSRQVMGGNLGQVR